MYHGEKDYRHGSPEQLGILLVNLGTIMAKAGLVCLALTTGLVATLVVGVVIGLTAALPLFASWLVWAVAFFLVVTVGNRVRRGLAEGMPK